MQMSMIILIGILSTMSFGISGDDKPSATDLLDKYALNQDKLNSSIIVKFETEEKYVKDDVVEIDRVAPGEVRLDGRRIFICVNQSYDRVFDRAYDKIYDPKISLDETDYRKFILWDGERYIKYYDYVEWSRAKIRSQNTAIGDLEDTWPGCPLFGIRYHNIERIDTIMRQCETLSVHNEMETIGSESCYVIDARGPSSTYTVWLNPKLSYSIVQADIQLSPGAKGEYDIVPENESRSFKLRDVQFKKIDDVYVPMTYTEHFESRKDSLIYRKGITRGKVTDITFNPDHENLNSFVPKMRNGTEINDEIAGLIFIWQDGKPELGAITLYNEPNALIDTQKKANGRQLEIFLQTRLSSIQFILFSIGLLVAAVIGLQVLRRIKT